MSCAAAARAQLSERARAGSRGGRGQRRAAGLCGASGGGGGSSAGGVGGGGASAGAAAGRRREPAASAAAPAACAPARSGSAMELPAVGEHVFAVESIEKKRIRKVGRRGGGSEGAARSSPRGGGEGVGRLRAGAGDPAEADGVLSLPPAGQSGVSGEMERLVPQVSSGGGAEEPGAAERGCGARDPPGRWGGGGSGREAGWRWGGGRRGWGSRWQALGKPSRRARARRPVLCSAPREMPSLIYALKGAGGAGETRGRAGEAGGGREGAGTD